jgi:hypothetical protein
MPLVDMEIFRGVASRDPEFVRETRYLSGAVKIGIADATYVLHFENGKIVRLSEDDTPDSECKIVVKGTRELWTNMLAEKPKPFYQCLQSTAVKHGLSISDTHETFAYLPALNRMTVLMRQVFTPGGRV